MDGRSARRTVCDVSLALTLRVWKRKSRVAHQTREKKGTVRRVSQTTRKHDEDPTPDTRRAQVVHNIPKSPTW
eukprot:28037-Eustigmatos_ZCMA.PRE.1